MEPEGLGSYLLPRIVPPMWNDYWWYIASVLFYPSTIPCQEAVYTEDMGIEGLSGLL